MKVSDRGARAVKDSGATRNDVLKDVIRGIGPYIAIVERAVHRGEDTISATDVAAHWHEHFASEVSSTDKGLNDQAVCFFQIAQGADLGTLTVGRKGMPTRFDFAVQEIRSFVDVPSSAASHAGSEAEPMGENATPEEEVQDNGTTTRPAADTNRVLYGDKFALVVEEGVDLPSNLQGLYECRYSGEELNMPATMELLKAMSEF